MFNPLARKLSSFADISEDDMRRLDNLCSDVRSYSGRHDLIKEGDRPEHVFLLVEGWAYRYKILPDGGRQIVAYLLPGDLCDAHIFILDAMDHAIGILRDARVAAIPKQKIISLFEESPALARALWWSTLVDEGVLREWIANMGRRNAFNRLGHLFAELWQRMKAVGLTSDGSFDLPLTQTDMADTLGLTSVHVNRTLQSMRARGLIEGGRGTLHIPNIHRLMNEIGFEPNYLHLARRKPHKADT